MYRVLRSCGAVRERRRVATHPPRTIPEAEVRIAHHGFPAGAT